MPPTFTGPGLIDTIQQEMVVIYYKEHLLGLIIESTFNIFMMDEAGDSRFWRYSYGLMRLSP
jgi:hypothetical protein